MTPHERSLWQNHFNEFPHGDFLVQRLLAIIASMIASIGGSKDVKPDDFAPWLNWPKDEVKQVKYEDTLEGRAMNAILDNYIENGGQ